MRATILAVVAIIAGHSHPARAGVCTAPAAQLGSLVETVEGLADAASSPCPTTAEGRELDFAGSIRIVCHDPRSYETIVRDANRYIESNIPWLSADERATMDRLSTEDRVALYLYTGACYGRLNGNLWTRAFSELPPDFQVFSARLYVALSKLPAHTATVRRGARLATSEREPYQPGAEVVHRGLTSASIDRPFWAGVQMAIESRTGRRIRAFSSHFRENEVLFGPYTRFAVRSRRDSGGTVALELEDLGTDYRSLFVLSNLRSQLALEDELESLSQDVAECLASGRRPDAASLATPGAPVSYGISHPIPRRAESCARNWIGAHAHGPARRLMRDFGHPGCAAYREIYPLMRDGVELELAHRYFARHRPDETLREVTVIRRALARLPARDAIGAELRRRDADSGNIVSRLRQAFEEHFTEATVSSELSDRVLRQLRVEWVGPGPFRSALERTLEPHQSALDGAIRGRVRACAARGRAGLRECLESGVGQDVRAQLELLTRAEGYSSAEAAEVIYGPLLEQRVRRRHQTLLSVSGDR